MPTITECSLPTQDAGSSSGGSKEKIPASTKSSAKRLPPTNPPLIEKDVPMPSRIPLNRGTWTTLARQMEIGDSVMFDKEADAAALRWALYSTGKKGMVRKIHHEGWRIWRTA